MSVAEHASWGCREEGKCSVGCQKGNLSQVQGVIIKIWIRHPSIVDTGNLDAVSWIRHPSNVDTGNFGLAGSLFLH